MKILNFVLLLSAVVSFSACTPCSKLGLKFRCGEDQRIQVTVMQINDVYEIAPLEGGAVGGMARVAQVKKDLLKQNKNTFLIHAGDFLNPSVIGTLPYEGSNIKGKQMVEAMNVAGVDLVTFGNHEFDIKENELMDRLKESRFNWTSCNILHKTKEGVKPFTQGGGVPVPPYYIKQFTDADGTSVKIAFIGVTVTSNQKDYVAYSDVFESFSKLHDMLRDSADIILGISHLDISDDKKIIMQNLGIPLLMGGHDHDNMKIQAGKAVITKADANAKSCYIHTIMLDRKCDKIEINSQLKKLDTSVPLDTATNTVVNKWLKITEKALSQQGFNPTAKVKTLSAPLDARESVVRNMPSPVTTWLVASTSAAAPDADCAVVNTGSVRIDDVVTGAITEYDVLRILPFGGEIMIVSMKGSTLEKTVKTGVITNKGKGGYLALSNVSLSGEQVLVRGKNIEKDKVYKVAMPVFLLTGKETNLEFLEDKKSETDEILSVEGPKDENDIKKDARKAFIQYLRGLKD